MAATLDVAQVGAYVEVSEESLGVAQVGAYVEVLYTRVLVSQVGAYVEIGPGPQTVTLDVLTLVGSVPTFSIIRAGIIELDALTLSSSVPSFSMSVDPDHSTIDHIQTTFNLPRSVRSKHVDGKLAGIDYADRQHSDTSKGKL